MSGNSSSTSSSSSSFIGGERNPGLEFALPITLAILLLFLILLLIVMSFASCREKLFACIEKMAPKKKPDTPKARDDRTNNVYSNKKIKENHNVSLHQQIRLFPINDFSKERRCGISQAGDVHYEEQTSYQAGRKSREAADLVISRSQSSNKVQVVERDKDKFAPSKHPDLVCELQRSRSKQYPIKSVADQSKIDKGENLTVAEESIYSVLSPVDDTDAADKKEKRKTFVAMYPLTSSSRDELNLLANDVIFYLGERNNGWLKGEKKDSGEVGWFPVSYVREGVSQAPGTSMFENVADEDFADNEFDDDVEETPICECLVKHGYQAELEGDLRLKEGDVVRVMEMLENGWWRGEGPGGSGFFPGSYVQILGNSTLVTRSCVDLSKADAGESQKEAPAANWNKRNSLGRQFFQKLSVLNLGTLKKEKPRKKIQRESLKVLTRNPPPAPLEVGTDSSPKFPFENEVSKKINGGPSTDLTEYAPCYAEPTKMMESSLSLNSDTVYGNLQAYSGGSGRFQAGTLPKPAVPPKRNKLQEYSVLNKSRGNKETIHTSSHPNPSDARGNSLSIPPAKVDGIEMTSVPGVLSPSVTLKVNRVSRDSVNFDEELKNRLNVRMNLN